MLLDVRSLSKTFSDGTRALRDVSFQIEEGEYTAIVGPSGSGKSTLLHILGLLDRPTGGDYFFMGKNATELDDHALAHVRNKDIGFVFQMFNLLPRISVLENVMVPLAYSPIPRATWKARAEEVLKEVGLSHRLEQFPTTLSGGEKQRVAIARALVNDPKIIFADEPTGNLDSVSGEKVVELLEGLNRRGRTVVLITHDMSMAKRALRTLSIKDGALVSDRTSS